MYSNKEIALIRMSMPFSTKANIEITESDAGITYDELIDLALNSDKIVMLRSYNSYPNPITAQIMYHDYILDQVQHPKTPNYSGVSTIFTFTGANGNVSLSYNAIKKNFTYSYAPTGTSMTAIPPSLRFNYTYSASEIQRDFQLQMLAQQTAGFFVGVQYENRVINTGYSYQGRLYYTLTGKNGATRPIGEPGDVTISIFCASNFAQYQELDITVNITMVTDTTYTINSMTVTAV